MMPRGTGADSVLLSMARAVGEEAGREARTSSPTSRHQGEVMNKLLAGLVSSALAGLASVAQAQVNVIDFNIGQPFIRVFNDRIGNSRHSNFPNTDRVRVSVLVEPSPDSDFFIFTNAQGQQFKSLNGLQTSVTVTHANFGTITPNPRVLDFIGFTSNGGGGRDEYTTTFNRANAVVAPLLDAWAATPFTVTVSNPSTRNGVASLAFAAPPFDKDAMPPFVTDLTLTGGGVNPRLDWVIPPGASALNAGIQIRRINAESADGSRITSETLLHERLLGPNVTTYTVNEPFSYSALTGETGLRIGSKYEMVVELTQFSGNVVKGNSRTFFEFAPLSSSTANVAVYLPSIGPDGVFKFNVTVNATDTIVIDPAVAIGYIYQTGAGDPNFRSVKLPDVGDGNYVIDVFDPGLGQYRRGFAAVAGTTYDFRALGFPDGVSKFRVKGVEASAALDSRNATAFLTTVGFMGAGRFTGAMVPITAYGFGGFLPPINLPPTINTGPAGSSFPIRWTLADIQGAAVTDLGSIKSISYKSSDSCSVFPTDPAGASTAMSSRRSKLRYNRSAGQYRFNWQSPEQPGCYALFLELDSGQVFSADFMLRQRSEDDRDDDRADD
jgi:hypothetical protein